MSRFFLILDFIREQVVSSLVKNNTLNNLSLRCSFLIGIVHNLDIGGTTYYMTLNQEINATLAGPVSCFRILINSYGKGRTIKAKRLNVSN